MAQTEPERPACYVCGAESDQTRVTAAREDGAPDLDTRPAEDLRSTMLHWVQRCPACGYCAPALAEGAPPARRVVATAGYKALLDGDGAPELARRFLASSTVLEHSARFADAGWQAVYAAWTSDDAGRAADAVACRERALELFAKATRVGQEFAASAAEQEALRADLLRRCGSHEAALARCQAGLALEASELLKAVLRYEAVLAARGDTAAHTVDEARAAQPSA